MGAISLVLFLQGLAAFGTLGLLSRALRRRRPFLEIAPSYRPLFRRLGLFETRHFLQLPTIIVSGHPDRYVGRLELSHDGETIRAFIKCELKVSWMVRFMSLLAGFGLVSRSLREARTLQALQREGIGCPDWLAAGEDADGKAFLLVREVSDSVELRTCLAEAEPSERRRVLVQLGHTLARIHQAGFEHFDLYAKHILVRRADACIHVLDWQRSQRQQHLDWGRRTRDLAALHATVASDLASPRDRLVCLHAYVAELNRLHAQFPEQPILSLRVLRARVEACSRRRLQRRHVREKREMPLPAATQEWVCLDGPALCVNPLFLEQHPNAREWLSLDRQPRPEGGLSRRWILEGSTAPLLLQRRDSRPWSAAIVGWLRGRSVVSTEQRVTGLLFRLQRHAVAAPRVLAMGQRWRGGILESFLLAEPIRDAVSLSHWLLRPDAGANGGGPESAAELYGRASQLLERLHSMGCYLLGRPAEFLGVATESPNGPLVVLRAEKIQLRRRPSPADAEADRRGLRRIFAEAGYRPAVDAPAGSERGPAADFSSWSPAGLDWPAGASIETLPGTVPAPGSDSGSFLHRLTRGITRVWQRPDWPLCVGNEWPQQIMQLPVTDRFQAKQGRSTGRWNVKSANGQPGRVVYLKRHYELPWWQGWSALLWPSRDWSPAMQEARNLEWARGQGVPVPEVVAAAEYIGPWGRLQSVLAVAELTDMVPLSEAVALAANTLDPRRFRQWKRSLIREMARLTRMLHDRHSFHKDLYLCHFYIARGDIARPPADWRGRVYLIDLHRLRRHRWTWRIWQMKDLAQLLYSASIPGIDTRDQLAFWTAYRGAGPRRGADRWLRRGVLFKWRRYCQHNARHGDPNHDGDQRAA